jgi:phage terminase small subunit
MVLEADFQAEIDAATTTAAEDAKQVVQDEGLKADGDTPFVADGSEKKESGDDGKGTADPNQGNRDLDGAGETGGDNQKGEAGSEGSAGASAEGGVDDAGGGGTDGDAGDAGTGRTSPEVIMRAIKAGISAADAVAIGSDKLVEQMIEAKESETFEQRSREELEALRAEDAEAAKAREKELEDLLPELDPDETDPAVIKTVEAMKKLITDQQAQLDSLRDEQKSHDANVDAARERELTQWFEGKASALTEEFGKVLGKDGGTTVEPSAQQWDDIATKVAVTIEGYRASNIQLPPLDDMFDEAARIVLRDEFAKMDEANLAERLAKRAGQEISRPGGSKSKTERSPIDEVADMIDRQYFPNR